MSTHSQTSIANLEKKVDGRHDLFNARLEQMSVSIARLEEMSTSVDEIRSLLCTQSLNNDVNSYNNDRNSCEDRHGETCIPTATPQ